MVMKVRCLNDEKNNKFLIVYLWISYSLSSYLQQPLVYSFLIHNTSYVPRSFQQFRGIALSHMVLSRRKQAVQQI